MHNQKKLIMHNLVLSPIDPEELIRKISDRVTENILKVVITENATSKQFNDFLTVQEAAEFLNLSSATVYTKVSRGELPFMKRSKRLYFSQSELMDYLKEGRKKSSNELEAEASSYLKSNRRK